MTARRDTQYEPHLDLTKIIKDKALSPDRLGAQVCSVRGRQAWRINWRVYDDFIVVSYGLNNQTARHKINLVKQPVNFGGFRYYLECPLCHDKKKKMFFNKGAYGCNSCMGINYRVNSESEFDRKLRRLRRLLRNHTDTTGRNSIYERPVRLKGQHKRKFELYEFEISRLQRYILNTMAGKLGVTLPESTN